MTLARCPLHWAHDLTNTELHTALTAVGLHPNVVNDLVRDRHTSGGEWRIEGELGPLPEHVDAGLMPAEGSRDPALCRCGVEDEPEPEHVPGEYVPLTGGELVVAAPPAEPPPAHVLADQLEYDEVGWAQEAAAAAEAQAIADAAEMGW